MGDKIVKISGGKGARRTVKQGLRTWCGSGRLGCAQACGLGCIIGGGRSLKKSKPTRENYEKWTTARLTLEDQ